jgi:O-antigen ligase
MPVSYAGHLSEGTRAGNDSGRVLTAALAVVFALVVNQGVIYYVVRFGLGIELLNPWPLFLLALALTTVALGTTEIDARFARAAYLFAMLNLFFAVTYFWSPSGAYGFQKALLTLGFPVLCLAVGFLVARDGHIPLFLGSCAMLACVTALVFVMSGHTPEQFSERERERTVIITYQNFAFIMALGAIWAIQRLAGRMTAATPCYALLLIGYVYFIILSGGRIGLLLVLVTVGIFLWSSVQNRLLACTLVAMLLLITGLAAYMVSIYAYDIAFSQETPATIRRLVHYAFIQTEHYAAGTRDVFYHLALDLILAFPLAGVGWGGFPSAAGLPDLAGFYPHNLLLELLSETGLIGTMAFCMFFAWLMCRFVAARGPAAERNLISAVLSAGFATSMVGGDWPSQRVLFFAFGAMIGFIARSDNSRFDASGQDTGVFDDPLRAS